LGDMAAGRDAHGAAMLAAVAIDEQETLRSGRDGDAHRRRAEEAAAEVDLRPGARVERELAGRTGRRAIAIGARRRDALELAEDRRATAGLDRDGAREVAV